MPPIPVVKNDVVGNSVEKEVAKVAGGVLGYIVGNLPGAVIGYNVVGDVYDYKGDKVRMLTRAGEHVRLPLVRSEYLGFSPSVSRVARESIGWYTYYNSKHGLRRAVRRTAKVFAPGVTFRAATLGRVYKRRRRRYFKYRKYK